MSLVKSAEANVEVLKDESHRNSAAPSIVASTVQGVEASPSRVSTPMPDKPMLLVFVEGDPDDPKNWSNSKKGLAVCLLAFLSFIA